MTTLITGGASQTGTALARLLVKADRKVLFGSRSGRVPDGFESVKFDWDDASTFENPFKADPNIKYVYLLPPNGTAEPLAVVLPLLELALKNGVERFILLSATAYDEKGDDSVALAKVHTYFVRNKLDYVVLRPTWFTENFLRRFAARIKEHNVVESIAPTGRIPFIATDDIGQAAFEGIVNPSSLPSREPYVVGPDFISYSDVADLFTSVLGRKITHKTVTKEELTQIYIGNGVPEGFAGVLVALEEEIEKGSEEKYFTDPRSYIGKVGVREWIEKHKDAF